MGIDLTLLVVDKIGPEFGFAHTVLEYGRNGDAFDVIEKCNPSERREFELWSYKARVPDGSMMGESCYGVVRETPYGEPLTYAYAGDVVKAVSKLAEQSERQLAAIAYLEKLEVNTLVALYWH